MDLHLDLGDAPGVAARALRARAARRRARAAARRRGCRPRARWRPSSASRAASSSRPTRSSPPRATCSPAAAAGRSSPTPRPRPPRPPRPRRATCAPPRYDLRPTLPALDGAFRPAWGRALNRALRTTPDARLGYPDPRGEPELRAVLAASLARRRGVHATPDDVRVTAGSGRACRSSGGCCASAASGAWRSRTRAGRGCPRRSSRPAWSRSRSTVDEHGMRVDGLETRRRRVRDPRAPVPDRHGPLPRAPRRADRRGRGARARSCSRTTTTPSTATTASRSARCRGSRPTSSSTAGRPPRRSRPGCGSGGSCSRRTCRPSRPARPPVLDQLALADLLERGDFDRHLRHHRRLYQRRREALLAAIAAQMPDVTVSGAAAGLHAVLHLADAHAVAEAAPRARRRARGDRWKPDRRLRQSAGIASDGRGRGAFSCTCNILIANASKPFAPPVAQPPAAARACRP